MNKIPCTSQNTEVKTLPADVCVFGCFGQLSTQLIYDLTPEGSGGSTFHPLSHIYAKTPFCCIETVANNALNRQRVVVFGWLWANLTPTVNTAFSLINVHAKWWIYCFLISSTPLLTSIYNWPKWVCGLFWCFPGQLLNLDNPSVQHHLSIRPCLKSAYHLLTVVSNGAGSE